MRIISPVPMAIFYFLLGSLLIYFATRHVGAHGWTFLSYFFVAFTAYDFFVGIRLLLMRKTIKKMQDK